MDSQQSLSPRSPRAPEKPQELRGLGAPRKTLNILLMVQKSGKTTWDASNLVNNGEWDVYHINWCTIFSINSSGLNV